MTTTEAARPETATDPAPRSDPAEGLGAQRVVLDPWDVRVGPVAHLAADRDRLAGLEFEHFDVRQVGVTLGAEVRGIDITSPLADPVLADLRRCLHEFKVVFFRDQPLTPAQHVAFAGSFGDLERHPFIRSSTGYPELVRFEKEAQVGGYENGWHSDVSWRERPSFAAVLHAVQVPRTGGDTLFADMCAAYDGLDPEVRERIAGRTAVHDYTRAFGHTVGEADRAEMRRQFPPVEHPVVRTNPDTGRKLLYVNRFFVDHVVGMARDESDELVDLLARQAETVEYQVRFAWAQDSIAMWDNRSVQHYASSDYWPQRRVMERASVVGERPR